MRRARWAVPAVLMLALAPGLAMAQGNAGPATQPAQKAMAGASTTDGTTNGSSGPKDKGPSGPNKASASLCDDFKGEAHAYCLYAEMNQAPKAEGGSQ